MRPSAKHPTSQARSSVNVAGVIAYGTVFMIALPALLAAWMHRLDTVLGLPRYGSRFAGALVLAAGLIVMAAAMVELWRRGGGLPMSPFPPGRIVSSGLYGLLRDPIYVGAVATCLGYALLRQSGTGVWVVTPVLAMAAASFVLAYERRATEARFGSLPPVRLRVPQDGEGVPTRWERASVYVLVLIPWAAIYEALSRVGFAPDTRSSYTAWDAGIPVVPWLRSTQGRVPEDFRRLRGSGWQLPRHRQPLHERHERGDRRRAHPRAPRRDRAGDEVHAQPTPEGSERRRQPPQEPGAIAQREP